MQHLKSDKVLNRAKVKKGGGPGHIIYGEMLWFPGSFHVTHSRPRGDGPTVNFNYSQESYKESGSKLLVVIDGKKKAEKMDRVFLGNSGEISS